VDFLDGPKLNHKLFSLLQSSRVCYESFDYDGLLAKPIAIDRFNASERAIDLHLLKKENKEEEGEHIL
jgi:hypothetical protein